MVSYACSWFELGRRIETVAAMRQRGRREREESRVRQHHERTHGNPSVRHAKSLSETVGMFKRVIETKEAKTDSGMLCQQEKMDCRGRPDRLEVRAVGPAGLGRAARGDCLATDPRYGGFTVHQPFRVRRRDSQGCGTDCGCARRGCCRAAGRSGSPCGQVGAREN